MKLKNLVKVFSVAAVLTLAMALMVGCSSGSSKSDSDYKLVNDGKLTVATSLDFPPFESLDGDTPTGYSVAVIQEVAKRLDLECEIKYTKFDTSITIDPERSKQVDFSDPYYIADQSIVVVKGAYTSVDQLKGKTIAAQTGTTGFDYAQENVSDNVVGFDEATACFAALQSKNAEAIAIDLPVAEAMISSAYPDYEILEKIATGEEYGIAINKDNTALKDAINKVLGEMDKDGTLKSLQDKYLG